MTAEQINDKIEFCESAIDLMLTKSSFTIAQLSEATGKTASQIYSLFPNKKTILKYYYPSIVIRYSSMIEEIEDFDSYSISEKLSNFIFTSFDMLDDRKEFVEDTFEKMVFKKGCNSEFHHEVTALFKHFFYY